MSYIKAQKIKMELHGYGVTDLLNGAVKVNLIFNGDYDVNKIIGYGFKLYDDTSNIEYDFSDCIYHYNIHNPIKNGITMTNNKSCHDSIITLTNEQLLKNIESAKNTKIAELSAICNQKITNGVDIYLNDCNEHFSYELTDQNNIDDIFNLTLLTKMPQSYHNDGGSYRLYSVDEIHRIYMEQKINKIKNVTYFNQLKLFILTLNDEEQIMNIEYGDELSGCYLDTYMETIKHYTFTLMSLIQQKNTAIEDGITE